MRGLANHPFSKFDIYRYHFALIFTRRYNAILAGKRHGNNRPGVSSTVAETLEPLKSIHPRCGTSSVLLIHTSTSSLFLSSFHFLLYLSSFPLLFPPVYSRQISPLPFCFLLEYFRHYGFSC